MPIDIDTNLNIVNADDIRRLLSGDGIGGHRNFGIPNTNIPSGCAPDFRNLTTGVAETNRGLAEFCRRLGTVVTNLAEVGRAAAGASVSRIQERLQGVDLRRSITEGIARFSNRYNSVFDMNRWGGGGQNGDREGQARSFAQAFFRVMASRSLMGMVNAGFEYAKNPLHDNYGVERAQKTTNATINTLAATGRVDLALISGLTSLIMSSIERRNTLHVQQYQFNQRELDTRRSFAQQRSDWSFNQLLATYSRGEQQKMLAGRADRIKGIVTETSKSEYVRQSDDQVAAARRKYETLIRKEQEVKSAVDKTTDAKKAQTKAFSVPSAGMTGLASSYGVSNLLALSNPLASIPVVQAGGPDKRNVGTTNGGNPSATADANTAESSAVTGSQSGPSKQQPMTTVALESYQPLTDAAKKAKEEYLAAQNARSRSNAMQVGDYYGNIVNERKAIKEKTDDQSLWESVLSSGALNANQETTDLAWETVRKALGKSEEEIKSISIKEVKNLYEKSEKGSFQKAQAGWLLGGLEDSSSTPLHEWNKKFIKKVEAGDFKETDLASLKEAMAVFDEEKVDTDKGNFKKIKDMYHAQQQREGQLRMQEFQSKYDINQVMGQYTDANRVTDVMARQGFFIGSQVDVQDVNKDILAEVIKVRGILNKISAQEVGFSETGYLVNSNFD